ncbi:hypothetical protein WJX81_007885 [Elliptochloris bilobata]|uniref:Amino acid transporter transmembrane domain-containing protein n=1 Tax=Elliptochloris bilobata TaxID=381761 RepID=A0AAW1QJT3_9CHLO
MGSALFPLPTAFEGTGLLAALLIMVVVAMVTVYACELLMDQCTVTGQHDYERLSYAVGGIWWQRFTEVSIVVLMVGTLVGGFVQTGEIFSTGALSYAPDTVPDWVQARAGSFLMVLAVLFIVFPASLVEVMTQLEYISMVGFVFVLVMTATVIFQACFNGLPGWYSGEFRPIGFQDIDSVGATVSVIGFAFYLQPIAMPMLREMPPGEVGYKILSFCMRTVIMGFAFIIYFCLGFFGAARWGASTQGNLLQNVWGPGPYQGTLNTLLGIYLAFTMPPICYPVAHVVKNWFPGGRIRNSTFGRRFIIVSCIIFPSLAIACAVPGKSADIVTATGAIGVFSSCYFVPIMNHFFLFFGWARCQQPGHPQMYTGEADEMSYRGNGKPGELGEHASIEDSAERGDPAFKHDKIEAAMEEANAKPGVTAVPASLETDANGLGAKGGKGGMICGDVHSYRSRRGMLSIREFFVDVLLPIVVLLIGALCSILAFRSLAQTAAAGGSPYAEFPAVCLIEGQGREHSGGKTTLQLSVASADEFRFVEAMLRHIYTKELSVTSESELLQMLLMADAYAVDSCVDCAAARLETGLTLETACEYMRLATRLQREHASIQPLLHAGRRRLLASFGALDDVWRFVDGRRQFVSLPLEAVQALLESPEMHTETENTAFVAVSVWLAAHGNDAAAAAKLAPLLRFPQLMSTFLVDVLCMVWEVPVASLEALRNGSAGRLTLPSKLECHVLGYCFGLQLAKAARVEPCASGSDASSGPDPSPDPYLNPTTWECDLHLIVGARLSPEDGCGAGPVAVHMAAAVVVARGGVGVQGRCVVPGGVTGELRNGEMMPDSWRAYGWAGQPPLICVRMETLAADPDSAKREAASEASSGGADASEFACEGIALEVGSNGGDADAKDPDEGSPRSWDTWGLRLELAYDLADLQ